MKSVRCSFAFSQSAFAVLNFPNENVKQFMDKQKFSFFLIVYKLIYVVQ